MAADIYPHPVDMAQVLRNRALRALLPTGMDSQMLRKLPAAVREMKALMAEART